MPTNTSNYSLLKPNINDPVDEDLWGGQTNANWDSVDTLIKTATDTVINAQSASYNVLLTDRNKIITMDATAASRTVNLLAAATAGSGFTVIVKKIDASANAVVIDGNTSETIDGQATVSLNNQYDTNILVCDGTNWLRVAQPTISLASANNWTGAQRGNIATLTDGATVTPDFSSSNNFTWTLGGNRALANPTNQVAGQSGTIIIKQDAAGSRTTTWGTHYLFPGGVEPTLSTAINAVDLLSYYVIASGSILVVLNKGFA